MSQVNLEPAQIETQPPISVPGPLEHQSPSTPEIEDAENGGFQPESYDNWLDQTTQEEEDLRRAVQ